MKFVYFGYDFMLGGVRRLMEDGHELAGIFTFECDNIFNFNRDTQALANELAVPLSLAPPQAADIKALLDADAGVFLAAGYPFKIPPVPEDRAYALNLHPSYLPKGRGLMPTPHILMHAPEAAGMSLHKMTEDFDAGDILWQEKFTLGPQETVETYSGRVALKAPEVFSEIFKDLPEYWQNARPQNAAEAARFPMPDDAMRTLDWDRPVEEIDRQARAFGRFGVLAPLEGELQTVYDLDVWAEPHSLPPGRIAARLSREIIIAARDGFVCLKEGDFAGPV